MVDVGDKNTYLGPYNGCGYYEQGKALSPDHNGRMGDATDFLKNIGNYGIS